MPTNFTHPTATTKILNTCHPHYASVYKDGPRKWTAVEFCNGTPIPGGVIQLERRRDAISHLIAKGYKAD